MDQDHKHNILVVDDEVELGTIIGTNLEFSGFDHAFAASGDEALALMKEQKFDLVVCDFVMPGMDGFTFFKETRHLGLTLPFIFCSGLDETPYKNDLPQGVVAFIQKPFPMSDLMDTITKFLLPS